MDKIEKGTLMRLCRDGATPPIVYLQAHQCKTITEEKGERLRLMLNDGESMINGVFKPSAEQPTLENFKKYCALEITQYEVTPTPAGKVFMVVDRARVVGEGEKPTVKFLNLDDYLKTHRFGGEAGGEASESKYTPPAEDVKPALAPAPKPKAAATRPNMSTIDQLSPYQNKWTIKARVSFKGEIRTWSNARGEGKLFSVNFMDETGEIRATGFNEAADKYYDLLKENKVYWVSQCRMVIAKPQFSHLKHHYELQLGRDSMIEECLDETDIPEIHYDFKPLKAVQDLNVNEVIDVIGVLKEVHEKREIVARSTGKPFDRRDVVIVDDSGFAVMVGLWNKHARDFDLTPGSVVAFKGARVQDFNGKSLSLIPSATIVANPDIREAHLLKEWQGKGGLNESFQSLRTSGGSFDTNLNSKESIADRKTIGFAQEKKLGFNEKPDYFTIKATVTYVRPENFCYPACQSEGCNRKVVQQSDDTWRCEKCDKNFAEPEYRYILTVSAVDTTGQMWLTLFNDEAKLLVGCDASDLLKLKDDPNTSALKNYIQERIAFKEYSLRVRAQQDSYNGIERARFNAVGVTEVDYKSELEVLVDQVK